VADPPPLANALLIPPTEEHLALFGVMQREDAPYFAAVGRFIVEYAHAEAGIHLAARSMSGMSDAKARAIFGGQRLSDLTERIRAMAVIDNIDQSRRADLEDCITQLDKIAVQRNKLVRQVTDYRNAALHVSNMLLAKSLDIVKPDVFGILDLTRMTTDCARIFARLVYISYPAANADPDLAKWLYEPWQYIPAQAASRSKRPHKVRKAPAPRRASSPG
jgi:hypothetical protein